MTKTVYLLEQIMKTWYMLTLVGKDQPGIVAKITKTLYKGNCNLGEASMARLGGNFSIMLMVCTNLSSQSLTDLLTPISKSLKLNFHLDEIEGELLKHLEPDVRITVFGADRTGIVAEVTNVLAESGLNILNLETDVGGSIDSPIYIMQIDGIATKGYRLVEETLKQISSEKNLETKIEPIDIMLG